VRRIRATLERAAEARAHQNPNGILIGCVGCKGGVGTTTVAVSTALTLAERGKVILADFSGDALTYLGRSPLDCLTSLNKLDVEQVDRRAIERALIPYSDNLRLLCEPELRANQAHAQAVFKRLTRMIVLDLGAWTFTPLADKQWFLQDCYALALIVTSGRLEVERARRILDQLEAGSVTVPVYPVWIDRTESTAPVDTTAPSAELGWPVTHVIPCRPDLLVPAQPDGQIAQALDELANILTASR
jgi:Flp pilus assembly CpaE family ATPase